MNEQSERNYDRTKELCFWKLETGKVCLNPKNKYDVCNGNNPNCDDYISNKDVRECKVDLTKYFDDVLM